MQHMRALLLLLALGPWGLHAQHLTHREWLIQSFRDMRLAPAFGERTKNAEQLASDSAFIAQMLAVDPDAHACAEHLIGLGFEQLRQGNMVHAMYRFNHAYLMEPQNPAIRRGYGAFFVALDRPEEAMAEYQKGLQQDSSNVALLLDLATVQLGFFQDHHAEDPERSERLLRQASANLDRLLRHHPGNGGALYRTAVCRMFTDDCAGAWANYRQCREAGAEVEDGFERTLRARCPTPP
ncbi:MAG: tetratricopeptide repeat protein [Flavobacteriales bacterium]|jgi:tetratricopeptide (TPR) repeat protein|nr:MAG: tetratricopeptide repeat protein [Flavobacteriales bacterium]